MWLKAYLAFGKDRPTWASIDDVLFTLKVPKSEQKVNPSIRQNVFLQSWQTCTSSKNQLPELKMLTDTARKYGVRIEGIAFSRQIICAMPIWYHKEASIAIRSMNQTLASNCLRTKHKVRTVGETLEVSKLCQSDDHEPNSDCLCNRCSHLRDAHNCEHPHGCARQASKLLDTLPPKWDPRSELPEDYQKEPDRGNNEEWSQFDNRVTTSGTIAEIFRIFTDSEIATTNDLPNLRPAEEQIEKINISTAASCVRKGESDARAGAGIYFKDANQLNRSAKLPLFVDQSEKAGEAVAVKLAADIIDPKNHTEEPSNQPPGPNNTNNDQRAEGQGKATPGGTSQSGNLKNRCNLHRPHTTTNTPSYWCEAKQHDTITSI
ncbi:hypothetical protein BT96DRAFT_961109 [Gymnopus androsaceus JB14]|uniref:Uncharacterized protein n=1 Tax=Gymnopus androsaceus JB14 TaxID=1447944 RepID=A0A6A4GBY6_9AGAR|nr:hypothetical protein BT96DRAFT_961109 [Gymnopus androsaceus JB14]